MNIILRKKFPIEDGNFMIKPHKKFYTVSFYKLLYETAQGVRFVLSVK